MATPYKRYQCNVWPFLRIRDLKFDSGILEVFSKREANLVEQADGFGVQIWETPLEAPAERVQSEVAHHGTKATVVTEVQEIGEVNEAVTPAEVLSQDEEPTLDEDGEVTVLGGGFYEVEGKKVRGKINLPDWARKLIG